MQKFEKGSKDLQAAKIFGIICILFAILTAWMFYITPVMSDDLWFSLKDCPGNLSEKFQSALSLTIERQQTEMLRFPNQITTFLLTVTPRSVTAIIIGLILMTVFYGGIAISNSKPGNVLSYIWLLFIMICLPWYDYGYVLSYLLNYLLPTALSLWTLCFIFSSKKVAHSHLKRLGILLLAFLCGWSHESFSAPIICGTCIWLLLYYKKYNHLDAFKFLLLISLAVGLLIILLSPAFLTRSNEEQPFLKGMPLWEAVFQLGPSLFLLSTAVLMSIPALIKRACRPRLIALITMALAAETIAICFYNGPRTTWSCQLFSACILLTLPSEYRLKPCRISTAYTAGFLIAIIVVINMSAAIIKENRHAREFNDIVEAYISSTDGTVFYDVSRPKLDLTLLKTSVRALNEKTSYDFISQYYGKNKALKILPSALKNFTSIDSADNNLYTIYDNYIIIKGDDANKFETSKIRIETTNGTILSRFRLLEFMTEDNKKYILVLPHAQILNPELKITRVILS